MDIKDYIFNLYEIHSSDLIEVRKKQREFIKFVGEHQFDDLEAEILYLLGKEIKPQITVEVGSLSCWSTSWLLNALRENGINSLTNQYGHIYSYDIKDSTVNWASGRYLRELAGVNDTAHDTPPIRTLTIGDAQSTVNYDAFNDKIVDLLFVDAIHNTEFHQWALDWLVEPLLNSIKRVPVIFHDVFVNTTKGTDESQVILNWLEDNEIEYFTPSNAFETQFNELNEHREKLSIGIGGNIHPRSEKNSMILFFVGGSN